MAGAYSSVIIAGQPDGEVLPLTARPRRWGRPAMITEDYALRWVGGALGARAGPPGTADWQVLGRGGSGRWRTASEAVSLGRARARAQWSPEDVVKSKPAVEEHALTRADMHAHRTHNAQQSTRTSGGTYQPTHKNARTPTRTNQHTCVHSLARLHER